ncbi:venom carboxylesterase-6-like [Periplaneta americana]|uniref:venom carboxylesterase-6-like n=1 Tax=Periplaneta americana TaxID=6978 RepID=UPI0037E8F107
MLFWVALLCATKLTFLAAEGPVVHTQQGTIHGTYLVSSSGRQFAAFQGIPYAQPPVGKLRFKEPLAPHRWKGTWNASLPGSACIQYQRLMPFVEDEDPIIGEEDCLYINVFMPVKKAGNAAPLLDVIFYIHGGALMYGWSHAYGPKYILDKDIILVTFNYRLGPMGFLSTEDKVVPGNMGLKDQTAALKWVHRNIAAFGGNPDSVTLIGNSAGGVSVHYHYISPMSRGLFKRGYSQSGSVLLPWALMEGGRTKAQILGAALGCATANTQQLTDCLRDRPARQIVQQVQHFLVWRYNPFAPFGPTVEAAGPNSFLSKSPLDAILQGDVQDLPWMTSATTEEGLYPVADWITNPATTKVLEDKYAEFFPHILDYNYTVPQNKKSEVLQQIIQHYFHGKPPSSETKKEMIQVATDRLFVADLVRAAKLQAAVNSAPVYFYHFGYRGKSSLSDSMSGTSVDLGVSHADDLSYTMDCSINNPDEKPEDKEMSNLLVDIWTSFARDGIPIPRGKNFQWKPTTPNSKELNYLYIGRFDNLEMRSSSNLGEQEFWDSLPINEPQIGKSTPLKLKHTEF